MTFTIKRGDTSPAIKARLVPADISQGGGITGFNEVRFLMRDSSDYETIVDADTSSGVTVEDASTGVVVYSWENGDTDETGMFEAEWEVTYSDNTVETFPNDRYIDVEIIGDIK